jgi:hypothetical protein
MEHKDATQPAAAPAFSIPDVTPGRPPGVLGWSLTDMAAGAVSALVAAIALSGGGFFCSVSERLSGANIAHGAALVGAGTIVGAILAVVGRDEPRFLSVSLLFTASTMPTSG